MKFNNITPSKLKKIKLNDLPKFCKNLRKELIRILSITGGHVGPNLGVIELTVALYYVFNFPKDRLVWDIGHQIYVQKILTNRHKELLTIRKNGKSPGYSNRTESIYDTVTSSHAGSSLSLAMGTSMANKGINIAVCGDAAFVEGAIQEALNHLSILNKKVILIINDNEMAIEENYGGYHNYFKLKKVSKKLIKEKFQYLDVDYFRTLDGHNIISLVNFFKKLKKITKPCIVHLKTIKSKGLENYANNSDVKLHWNPSFDINTFESKEKKNTINYEKFAEKAVLELFKNDKNKKHFVVTPAVRGNTGMSKVFKEFPKQSIDVSIAEQHSLSLACGMAIQGLRPIVTMESTFMIRSFGQMIHDMCINNLPVLMISARSGHGFTDHITHNAMQDISYLRSIPNLRIYYPTSSIDLYKTILQKSKNIKHPTIILFPKANNADDPSNYISCDGDNFSKLRNMKNLILSVGPQNLNAQKVQKELKTYKINIDHICVRNIYPVSNKLVKLLKKYKNIFIMEEGYLDGGFGSQILEIVNESKYKTKVKLFGFKKKFIEHGTRDYIYKINQLDAKSITNEIIKSLKN